MPTATLAHAVTRMVTYAHVADVDASLAFYALLGFSPKSVLRDNSGRAFWSLAQSGSAEIMLARASGPIDHAHQAVLFYMYSPDVRALRDHLLANNGRDAGAPGAHHADPTRLVHHVTPRDYMPAGELRLTDPDAYVILVGQLS